MKPLWMIAAGGCIVIAGFFLVRGQFNAAFVAAVIGLAAWFLNYRAQASESLEAEQLHQDNDQEGDENADET